MTKLITRSHLNPMPEYFDRYINLADDVSVLKALETSLAELKNVPLEKWNAVGDLVYAPGKWTIKDILQHLIDTERVFCYRALSFSRGENEVKSYDEQLYGKMANANNRSLQDLLDEAIAVRIATIYLYKSFDDTMISRIGIAFKGPISVHAIGYIFPGHQRWHFKAIEEKYLPLITN